MAKEKRSFFERLTGTVKLSDEARELSITESDEDTDEDWIDEESKDAELTVDVHQNAEMIVVKGGVTTAKGFLAGGVKAGIKKSGNKDLALLYSEAPAAAAARPR